MITKYIECLNIVEYYIKSVSTSSAWWLDGQMGAFQNNK